MRKNKWFDLNNILMVIAIITLGWNTYIRYQSNSNYEKLIEVRAERLQIEEDFKNAVLDLDTSMTNWMIKTDKFNKDRKEFNSHLKTCKNV